MELLNHPHVSPSQGDLFGACYEPPAKAVPPRAVEEGRLQTRPSFKEVQQDALDEIRARLMDRLRKDETAPISLHVLMCQMSLQRSYRLVVTKDLFGEIVVDRHWGSLVSRRGGSRRTVHRSDDETSRRLVLRTLSTRQRHGYELVGESSV